MKFVEAIDKDIEEYSGILELKDASQARKCVKQIELVYGKRVDGLNGIYRNSIWDGDADWINLLGNAIRSIEFYREEFIIKNAHDQNVGVNRLSSVGDGLGAERDVDELIAKAKDELEGVVSDAEYEEVAAKLDELEKINGLDESLGKKWLQIKPILNWSITKGVDVVCHVLPVIQKVLHAGRRVS